ncbi:MAG: type II secretion system F family protein [Cystobacterineae bacterium]|nr:type II secretion system F family protein [Cystobacterineae bacterium]
MQTVLISGGILLAALATAAAIWLFVYWLYRSYLQKLSEEISNESLGGMKGAGNVIIRRLGVINRQFMWPAYDHRIRRQLVRAGEPADYHPEEFMALQEIGLVLGLVFGIIGTSTFGIHFLWALIPALIGLFYPRIWLNDQVKKRHLKISRALPYNLDLLTLSVEAGLDFTGALGKVVEKGKPGPLLDEFNLVLKQLKMGKSREESLKSMAYRIDLQAVTQFISALIQADRMGTSLGKVLRIQSVQLRIDRTQRAEKLAGEAPVKMLFPLIACIFPTVFLVLFSPIVYTLLNS